MKKKSKNLWLWILIALAIVIGLLFIFFLKPSQQSISGGGNTPGTGTPTAQEAPCERCQARWGVDKFYWTCTGTCDVGTCQFGAGEYTNPFAKPTCYCGQPPTQTEEDNCQIFGGITSAPYCGGNCVDTSKVCKMTIIGTCECGDRSTDEQQIPCSQITAIGDPSDCARGTCPITGQSCVYDRKYGICSCTDLDYYMPT